MSEDKNEMSRDLIVMIGMSLSGKTYHVDNNYLPGYQLVSFKHLNDALMASKMKSPDIIYATMEMAARSHMIKGLPVVIDESNITVESLFMWKAITREHGYNLKGIYLDTPLDVCTARLRYLLPKGEKITEAMHEKLGKEYEQTSEIKEILKMKHQSVVDDVIFITYDGG